MNISVFRIATFEVYNGMLHFWIAPHRKNDEEGISLCTWKQTPKSCLAVLCRNNVPLTFDKTKV